MIMKGQKINDRYQIIKTIGEGGMANVYLAYDTILDRNVAVKILRGDLSNDEKFLRRFQREALSASSLSHPNIVEVYDVGEDNGQYYIIMEYIEGRHLKELVKKRGHLTISEVIDIMLQVTDGIAHAHDSYIIHRDIKPQNIMCLENGLIKITDFGIAMAMNSTQLTQTNSVMGSVHYLPPEQASGKGSTIQSDIYSMGILMYELLSGQLPYRGDNAVEIALKHLKEPLPSIRELLPDLPQSIENIILKATAKNPKNRYVDAREMHEDLKTAMDDSRVNEVRYEFPYAEGVTEDTKVINDIKKQSEEQKVTDEEIIAKRITSGDLKKENKLIVILASIFTGLVLVTTCILFLVIKLNTKSNVEVPDVSGLSITQAEKKLMKLGLEVATETRTEYSDKIESGNVIKTSPSSGRTVKEGTTITIYESLGNEELIMKNYVGENYVVVKAELEMIGINVVIEKIEVDNPADYKNNVIIKQSPSEGSELKSADTVTFFIPDIESVYPDFVVDGWTKDAVESFANDYNLKLSIEYKTTDEFENGAIISQSRASGTDIITGATLKIVIAEAAVVDDGEGEEDLDDTGLLE